MYAHPDEAGDIVATVYDLEPAVARSAVHNLTAPRGTTGLPYWGPGDFHIDGMNRMIEAQKLVGISLEGSVG